MENAGIQGTPIPEDKELRKRLRVVREGDAGGSGALVRIIKYHGKEREPEWMDVEPGITCDFEV